MLSAVAAIWVGRRLKPEQQRPVVIVAAAAFLALSIWAYTGLGSDREFLALWLPYGALGGAVLGAALTSVTTAASISVHPLKFATGTGMSTTARQFGGAVGVASMAAVFAAGDLSTPQPYLDAFLLAGIYIAASAVPGFWLFTKKSMAQIAETQRQIQAHMRAQAEAAAKAAAAASSADRS